MEPHDGGKWRTTRRAYPALRERSVRMVLEHAADYRSERLAIQSIAGKMGMHPDTLKA